MQRIFSPMGRGQGMENPALGKLIATMWKEAPKSIAKIHTRREKSKFESQKTHFDTNHHLTVSWNKDQPVMAMETLKATIRATLPEEAKLTDE